MRHIAISDELDYDDQVMVDLDDDNNDPLLVCAANDEQRIYEIRELVFE